MKLKEVRWLEKGKRKEEGGVVLGNSDLVTKSCLRLMVFHRVLLRVSLERGSNIYIGTTVFLFA